MLLINGAGPRSAAGFWIKAGEQPIAPAIQMHL